MVSRQALFDRVWRGMAVRDDAREPMMRELMLALEEIASDTPLLLKLEDMHRSDARIHAKQFLGVMHSAHFAPMRGARPFL